MKTYQPKQKDVVRRWHLVDAKGQVLGRMASEIARFLIGKHKSSYSSHMDTGDYVVVINAKKIEVTGAKEKDKVYYKHSGYPGGFKEVTYRRLFRTQPAKVVERAVKGMLPKNRLHAKRMRRMKIFLEDKHPYGDKLKS